MNNQNSISQAIMNREYGCGLVDFPSNLHQNWLKILSAPQYIIENHSFSTVRPDSKIIWLEGKENILITLDSHGRIVCHNLLSHSKQELLTTENEHAYKAFFFSEYLICVVKSKLSENIKFFAFKLEDLQSQKFERLSMLEDLKINIENIKEIIKGTCKIVVENFKSIQLWDIFNSKIVYQFPLNSNFQYQITQGKLLVWQSDKNFTTIGIIDLESSDFLGEFKIMGNQKIYLCEVKGNKLIIGMHMCHLQIIDIKSKEFQIINRGMPQCFYYIDENEEIVVAYRDGNAIVIGNNEIFQVFIGTGEGFCGGIKGLRVFCEKNGKISVFDKGKVQKGDCGVKGLDQIGVNQDTSQIFLTCKGKIYVFE